MPRKNLLPDARDAQRLAAAKDAEKADDYVRVLAEVELEKRALTERLGAASAVSEADKIRLTAAIIRRLPHFPPRQAYLLRVLNSY